MFCELIDVELKVFAKVAWRFSGTPC